MDDEQDIISAWIATEIIPHESAVHGWLSRRWSHVVDVEDVIQDAYCRIANLACVDHIDNPKAYFFRTAHAVLTDMMRRAGIINFTSATQIDLSNVMDIEPLVDRRLEAVQELDRVNKLLSRLSDTHRQAIELRRIEGLSRKETAERLGLSADALKKQIERSIHQVMKAMVEQDAQITDAERKQAKG
ncbi:RNA polymerase sigma factor [Sphingobium yanoikuyae]|uniref:RNA polymerase sigma factor n=1 Tax=Sphingobium yanoikuyae TaxID=13690 RepID=UPI000262B810|nr:sigma-70 family RNA polymerase sigma factor [Sphingobium yanoikuyae]